MSSVEERDQVPGNDLLNSPTPTTPDIAEGIASPAESIGVTEQTLSPATESVSTSAGDLLTSSACNMDVLLLPARVAPQFPVVVDICTFDRTSPVRPIVAENIRVRAGNTISRLSALIGSQGVHLMFDADREFPQDKAIKVAAVGEAPLWFIGDLHGDLLALEMALALIKGHPEFGSADSRIIFLGDLFDDEGFGLETLLRIFELIVVDPMSVCLIAGNHDEALGYDGEKFTSTVSPSDFAELLNRKLADETFVQTGKLAIQLFANAPRALFFPDGLLVAHGGFPLTDHHAKLKETGNWNNPSCLSDFVWGRAHPTARKKIPNRFTRGSQFGREDFAAFCSIATSLGRPVTHMVRGHDHVEERYLLYPAYRDHPILTTVALSRRLSREFLGTYERAPTIARYTKGAVPQVFRLHTPANAIRDFYPETVPEEVQGSE